MVFKENKSVTDMMLSNRVRYEKGLESEQWRTCHSTRFEKSLCSANSLSKK